MGGGGLSFEPRKPSSPSKTTTGACARLLSARELLMNPLNNHRQSLILGIVLALLLAIGIGGVHFKPLGMARLFHLLSGVFLIGLLFYFNLAQTPALGHPPPAQGGPPWSRSNHYAHPPPPLPL